MNILAELPYVKVIRKITMNKQQAIEEDHQLMLCDDVIFSDSEQFDFCDVLDISHHLISEYVGFLYLHTNRGLFSFHIKTDPTKFINTFKKQKHYEI